MPVFSKSDEERFQRIAAAVRRPPDVDVVLRVTGDGLGDEDAVVAVEVSVAFGGSVTLSAEAFERSVSGDILVDREVREILSAVRGQVEALAESWARGGDWPEAGGE